jgi:hypothetical protein
MNNIYPNRNSSYVEIPANFEKIASQDWTEENSDEYYNTVNEKFEKAKDIQEQLLVDAELTRYISEEKRKSGTPQNVDEDGNVKIEIRKDREEDKDKFPLLKMDAEMVIDEEATETKLTEENLNDIEEFYGEKDQKRYSHNKWHGQVTDDRETRISLTQEEDSYVIERFQETHYDQNPSNKRELYEKVEFVNNGKILYYEPVQIDYHKNIG